MSNFAKKIQITALLAATFIAMGFSERLRAETLYESVLYLSKNQKQIKAAQADVDAAIERVETARGAWYPELAVTTNWGREKQNKGSGTDDSEEHPREFGATVTQNVWDFGSTNSAIDTAKLTLKRSSINLDSTRQAIVLQGIEAHLNLIRANKVYKFAKTSAENIRGQLKLEDARVKRGGGLATDVLQAKAQLAGAQARANTSASGLTNAINAYRRFFKVVPEKIEDMDDPRIPFELLPKSEEEMLKALFKNNLGLKLSKLDADLLDQTVIKTRADEFFPKLNATASTKAKADVGGTAGSSTEQLFKIELSYSLNLGLIEQNTLMASKKDHLAGTERYIDARSSFEQQARDLWSNYKRDRENSEFLQNQANIASEFLELARKERELGNRTLMDVLSGETALINANSDATSTETDLKLDAFRILNLIGLLEPKILSPS